MGVKGFVASFLSHEQWLKLCRLYNIIGKGRRVALAKLAIDHLEQKGRPLRLAIDFSIWHFQIQSGQGGANPAVRTLYFRLLKLLGTCVQPLFVFDGPQRPAFKRDKLLNREYTPRDIRIVQRLLQCFGFPFHRAPGEAEAECAMLQRQGVVDAVLTEDVDSLMFGCTSSLRNWTIEKGKTSVYLDEYSSTDVLDQQHLDGAGMILIALMSGGDYDTGALVKCGYRTAYEAAKAGFGRDLLLAYQNPSELVKWRGRLRHELQTNESAHFRQKHPAISIPDTFPNTTVLGYYATPIVSPPATILSLDVDWSQRVDVQGLRKFVAEIFAWSYLKGAYFFVKGLAAPLLVQNLHRRSVELQQQDANGLSEDLVLRQAAELNLIEAITLRRTHASMEGCSELRVTFTPSKIVGLDLSQEEETYQSAGQNVSELDNQGTQAEIEGEDGNDVETSTQEKASSAYDPNQPERAWLPEVLIQLGAPVLAENWENDLKELRAYAAKKARPVLQSSRVPRGNQCWQQVAMDQFVRITKAPATNDDDLELLDDASKHEQSTVEVQISPSKTKRSPKKAAVRLQCQQPRQLVQKASSTPSTPRKKSLANFDLDVGQRPLETFGFKTNVRYSALGIYPEDDDDPTEVSVAGDTHQTRKARCAEATLSMSATDDDEDLSLPPHFTNVTMRTPRAPRPRQGLRRAQTEHVIGKSTIQTSRKGTNEAIDLCGTPSSGRRSGSWLDDRPPGRISIDLTGSGTEQQSAKKNKLRRLVALRESLEGAWRYAEPEETRLAKEVLEAVDIVDLTDV